MKKTNNILIFIFTLLSLCFAAFHFNNAMYDRLIGDLSIAIVFFIPRIITKIFKLKFTDLMELVYIIFVILAQFIGCVVNVFNTVWWYDLFTHFISGVLTGILALVILNWFKMYDPRKKIFNFLYLMFFSLSVASIWEFIEFGAFVFIKLDVQHTLTTGVFDTMEDMLIAFLGSLIVGIICLIEGKKGTLKKIVSDLK